MLRCQMLILSRSATDGRKAAAMMDIRDDNAPNNFFGSIATSLRKKPLLVQVCAE